MGEEVNPSLRKSKTRQWEDHLVFRDGESDWYILMVRRHGEERRERDAGG